MLKRWALCTLVSLFSGAAFANPVEEERPKRSPPIVAGTGISVPRASGMAAPSGVMHKPTEQEEMAELIKRGEMDPRLYPHPLEPRITLAPSNVVTVNRLREGIGVFFRDDYSTYQLTNFANPPSSLISINGQVSPTGHVLSADHWLGAATDAVMMTVSPGEPGGAPPIGALSSTGQSPGHYLALARASGQDTITTAFGLAMNYRFDMRAPTVGQPLIYTDDWFLQSAATAQWWSPLSFFEGCVMDRVFFGGTRLGGVLGAFENDDQQLDRIVSLGVLAGNPQIGAFYAAPRDDDAPLPIGEWFQLSAMMSISDSGKLGQGLWMKSADTVAAGFLDSRMAAGDLIPSDFDPAGWVNLYPGIEDDPKTLEREGLGVATTMEGLVAPTTGHLGLAPPLAVISLSGNQYGEGLDPVGEPNFQPDDAFVDNTTIVGEPLLRPSVLPDHLAPFFDGFELYSPRQPMRLQTQQWLPGYGSTALAVPSPNREGQALAQSHSRGHNLLDFTSDTRVEFTGFETQGVVGDPVVVSMSLQLNPSSSGMSRVIELRTLDGEVINSQAFGTTSVGAIVFGAADPTNPSTDGDGQIWVLQQNPDFDAAVEWHDDLVQRHWAPSELWQTPPADSPLNTQSILVPTGVAFPTFTPFEFRAEIEPDSNPSEMPVLRVFLNDAVLHPNGDPSAEFVANGVSISGVRFLAAAAIAGDDSSVLIDDFLHDSPLRVVSPGPSFALSYLDDFGGYPAHETVHGHGDTPFLSLDSVPDQQNRDYSRMLTVIDDADAVPSDGELVCRYLVDEVYLNSGLISAGEIIAISYEQLPRPYDTLSEENTDCPGRDFPSRFVLRPAPNQPRLETGEWSLIEQDSTPTPFDSGAGDLTGFRYDFFNEPRWRLAEPNASAMIRPLSDALGVEGGESDHALEVRVLTHDPDGPLNSFPMYTTLTSILPAAEAATASGFANPERTATIAFDLYIESLDATGAPSDIAPPRSRFSVPLLGVGGSAGRVTTIMFGGPHVNEHPNFEDLVPPIEILAPDVISVSTPSGLEQPDVKFESTGVSLLTGGAGLDGSISGPLVNRWIRISASVNADSVWCVAIDEVRDGALAPVTIATEVAIDKDAVINDAIAHTSGFDGLNINQGRDIASGGEPTPRRARIETLPGEAFAIAPANADPFEDYCFYATTYDEGIDHAEPPLIAAPGQQTAEIVEVRPLEPHQDVIAVLNRRLDGAGNVIGSKIHKRCPWDSASGVNQFEVLDAQSGDTRYQGRWQLLGDTALNNVIWPKPAGGVAHIDGPAQDPPIAYNDPSLAPPDYPALPVARAILLAAWADDEHDGWDPMPPVLPAQRWLIDNVRLEEIELAPPCPDLGGDPGAIDGADLAQLLASWGQVEGAHAADLNGDGFVNGADLATLLANWGACPDS